jgi:hypothetical protein
LAIGAVLFVLAPSPARGRGVHIEPGDLAARRAEERRRLGVATLSDTEARAVEAHVVEDEILYREALRLGLDRGDSILRQRLIQKVLFLAEDLGGASREPREDDLRAYFEATRERWMLPESIRLVHVFASSREALDRLRPEVIAWSRGALAADAVPPFGEPLPISRSVSGRIAEIAVGYGPGFAEALGRQELGKWSEPIASKYGFHLVKVVDRRPARPAAFADVRGDLSLAYAVSRREEAVAAFLQQAFARYEVDVGGERLPSLEPSRRVAARTEGSAED